MYEFDSFFSLSEWERVGLVGVSLGFALICAALVWWGSRARRWPLRVPVALVVLYLFVWTSPQGYYAYYRMIIDDLQPQLVIRSMPTFSEMWGHLTFTGRATLSSHTKGILGWVLIGLALLRRRKSCRDAAN